MYVIYILSHIYHLIHNWYHGVLVHNISMTPALFEHYILYCKDTDLSVLWG